jgi:hypothetical protein
MFSLLSFPFLAASCATTRAPAPAVAPPPAPAAKAAAVVAAASRQEMRAGGIEVHFDAPGWTQTEGPQLIEDAYYRLGRLRADGDRTLTVLVDDEPTNALDALRNRTVARYRDQPQMSVVAEQEVAGRPAFEVTFVSHEGSDTLRRYLFVETLMADHWLSLHYAAAEEPGALARARAVIEPMFASLKAQPTASAASSGELAALNDYLSCPALPASFYCRALVAFTEGTRPAWPSERSALAGAAMVIPGPGSPQFHINVQVPSALFIGDHLIHFGPLDASDKKELDEINLAVDAIAAERPLPARNATPRLVRGLTPVLEPGLEGPRSLVWRRRNQGHVRETKMGLVVIELVDAQSWVISVHPRLPDAH